MWSIPLLLLNEVLLWCEAKSSTSSTCSSPDPVKHKDVPTVVRLIYLFCCRNVYYNLISCSGLYLYLYCYIAHQTIGGTNEINVTMSLHFQRNLYLSGIYHSAVKLSIYNSCSSVSCAPCKLHSSCACLARCQIFRPTVLPVLTSRLRLLMSLLPLWDSQAYSP